MTNWFMSEGEVVFVEHPLASLVVLASFLLFCFYFYFAFKKRYEQSRRAVMRKETGRRRRQKVSELFEAFRKGEKRACLNDEEILEWLKDEKDFGLDDLLEEENIDFVLFTEWLEASVHRARVSGSIKFLKSDVILHPDIIETYLVEILAHCKACGFQLEEFGTNKEELKELERNKSIAWGDWEFGRYQKELSSLEEEWNKVVKTLLERYLPNPALKEKFVPVSLSVSESK